MTQNLFVYGTLAPGQPNEHILTDWGGTWSRATVKGHLKPEGWGAEMGCPGLVLDAMGEDINGFIFSSDQLDAHLHELDRFEGVEYQRVLTTVMNSEGQPTEAYVYALRKG